MDAKHDTADAEDDAEEDNGHAIDDDGADVCAPLAVCIGIKALFKRAEMIRTCRTMN
jgi:hypothetical protein